MCTSPLAGVALFPAVQRAPQSRVSIPIAAAARAFPPPRILSPPVSAGPSPR